MVITKIRIKNFRSIADATISLENLTVFVGDNDVGKSNILRALNLFFNNKTDGHTPFRFVSEFNHNATVAANKAKEIIIELTISPPSNYQGAKDVVWRKVWRREGQVPERSVCRFSDGTDFGPRSKIATWLSRMRFKYVPATKGTDYFSELLGELHDCLSTTVDVQIKAAATNFTDTINKHTEAILRNLEERLGIKSSIQLPSDLKSLFVNLDFQATQSSLSLKQRGDGIKARHIPIVLRFLADQDNFLRDRGSPQFTHIWGYEEPENNLELTKAFSLAEEFREYSDDVQILLTTHSPAFYQLHKEGAKIYYLTKKTQEEDTTVTSAELELLNDFDEMMGAMPLIAPHVEAKVKHYKDLLAKAEALSNEAKKLPTLFVEGPSDVAILKKAFNLFAPESVDKIKIITSTDGFGAGGGWVTDMLIAWLHSREKIKAAGLFDADQAGKEGKKKVTENSKYAPQNTVKPFVICKTALMRGIFKKGVKIEVAIEESLDMTCWRYAESQGWLERRPKLLELNLALIDDDSKSFDDALEELELTDDEKLIVKHRCSMENKGKMSKYVARLPSSDARVALAGLEGLVQSISKHLLTEGDEKQ